MPKIKLKPNRESVEVGAGNGFSMRIQPGEIVEVAPQFVDALLNLGHFDIADEDDSRDITNTYEEAEEKESED